MKRIGRIARKTKETKIAVVFNIDGEGKSQNLYGHTFSGPYADSFLKTRTI